ncbi:hypothetical protein BKA70DRAFT_1449771 [Coprinopsis sp. MPI-PUGE-AT-0042]|nr:hypothetical protein BKA70DRAFT_1449771 [Coprinopsis sp. MPI-PUGE-AT-0042]
MPRAKRHTNPFETLENDPGQSSPEPATPLDNKAKASPYDRPKGKDKLVLPPAGIAPNSIRLYLRSSSGKIADGKKPFTLPGSYADVTAGGSHTPTRIVAPRHHASRPSHVDDDDEDDDIMAVESLPKETSASTAPAPEVQMTDATRTQALDNEEGVSASIHAIPTMTKPTAVEAKSLEPNTAQGSATAPLAPAPTTASHTNDVVNQSTSPNSAAFPSAFSTAADIANVNQPPAKGATPLDLDTAPAQAFPHGATTYDLESLRSFHNNWALASDDEDEAYLDDDEGEDETSPYRSLGLTYLHDFERFTIEINEKRVWEGVPEHKKISWSKIPGEKMIAWCGYAKPTADFMVRNERILDGAFYLSGARDIHILNTDVDSGPQGNPPHRQLQPYLITGLTFDQAQSLEEGEYAVTADSFVIFKPFTIPNPAFVAAFPGIPLRNDKPHHKPTVRKAFRTMMEKVRPHVTGFLNVHHDRIPDHIAATKRYNLLLNTLEVEALQTSNKGADSVTWVAYLNPPTSDPTAWEKFAVAVKKLPLLINDYPYYAYRDDYHCSGCHAMNHPSSKCPFRSINGYTQCFFPSSNSVNVVNADTSSVPAPADNIFLSQQPADNPFDSTPEPLPASSHRGDHDNSQPSISSHQPPPRVNHKGNHPNGSPGPARGLNNRGRGTTSRGRGRARGL